MTAPDTNRSHYHFVTGRLAAAAVDELVAQLAIVHEFKYSLQILPITVAALITPKFLKRHLRLPPGTTDLILPGYLQLDDVLAIDGIHNHDGEIVATHSDSRAVRFHIGPKDYRRLPELFGQSAEPLQFVDHQIEIIAEINHVPRLTIQETIAIAKHYQSSGADRIDLGCDPNRRCDGIAEYVTAVIDLGTRVSIDSFDPDEVTAAVSAGADLVLSVNSSNRHLAAQYGCEVVAIPDVPDDRESLVATIDFLIENKVRFRIDPILEPIGTGLANSIVRYHWFRDTYPELPMLMGIGNLTELTDVDSAGVNFMLLGLCGELNIQSVLTTEVINWARSSVRECDVARRLVHHSVKNKVPPKRLSDQLTLLRDDRLLPHSATALSELAAGIKDNNYRIFAQDKVIRIIAHGIDLQHEDPFLLFDQLIEQPDVNNIDLGHAFYLGYELSKARLALQLGKQYEQDQSLNWGFLTVPENLHRIKRRR